MHFFHITPGWRWASWQVWKPRDVVGAIVLEVTKRLLEFQPRLRRRENGGEWQDTKGLSWKPHRQLNLQHTGHSTAALGTCHVGLNNSPVWEAVLCLVGCSAAALLSATPVVCPHQQSRQPRVCPDIGVLLPDRDNGVDSPGEIVWCHGHKR